MRWKITHGSKTDLFSLNSFEQHIILLTSIWKQPKFHTPIWSPRGDYNKIIEQSVISSLQRHCFQLFVLLKPSLYTLLASNFVAEFNEMT